MNKYFKQRKKELKLTNAQIAAALGVTDPTVGTYLKRPHLMRYGQLQVMAKLFGVGIEEMLRLAEESEELQKKHNAEMERLINKKQTK